MTKRHATHWALTGILLLAALLRLGAFQEALVGADQASILAAAADIVDLRDLPGVGIKSSVGVMQTATVAYLAAIPLLLVRRVVAVSWFFGVLDVLAIALLARAVRRRFGVRAAIIAALLYGTNPWVVEFNRWIWYQTLIPTFATAAFSALLLTLGSPSAEVKAPRLAASQARAGARRCPLAFPGRGAGERGGIRSKQHLRGKGAPSVASIPLAMVSATLMGLVHLAAVPWTAAIWAVTLIVAARRRWWPAAAIGLSISLLVAAPYMVFLARSGFADVGVLLGNDHTDQAGARTLNTAAYRLTYELLTGQQVLSTPRNSLWSESVLWSEDLLLVLPIALVLAVIWAAWRLTKSGRRRPALALTLGWTLLAPTLLVATDIHLQHFYLLFVYPAPFVLIGAAVEAWLSPGPQVRRPDTVRWIADVAVLVLLLLSAWWSHLWLVRIGYEQRGLLRAPTRAWLMDRAVKTVEGYLDGKEDREVILLTRFDAGGLSPFDWIRNFLATDAVRTVPAGGGLIVPAGETCYVLAEGAGTGDLAPVSARAVRQSQMDIPARPPWTFTCAGPRPDVGAPLAAWQNGLALLDAAVAGEMTAGERLDLTLTWHYRAATTEEYHFFHHLVRDGEMVAQVDGEGVPFRFWRDDDVLITRFVLHLPDVLRAGSYELRVGSYTWPGIERVFLNDGADGYAIAAWEVE